MNKILQIVDVPNWAIATLAKAVRTYNPQFNWRVLYLHPKDLEAGKYNLKDIAEEIKKADVIDIQYWRSGSQLMELIPEIRNKKIMLTHHNEKNLLSYDWQDVDLHIAKTKYSVEELQRVYPESKIIYIPNSFDYNIFQFNEEYNYDNNTVGYVGRFTPWKGLKEVIRACKELNLKLMVMGKIDKSDYWQEIQNEFGEDLMNIVDFSFMNCADEDKPEFYKNIGVYVGNSGPKHEVGTLGVIEALACGVPVVSSPAGIVADIHNGENIKMFDYGDYENMKQRIQEVIENKELRKTLRETGWNTIKHFNDEQMAHTYRKAINSILFDDDLVSVIIPATFDRTDNVEKIIESLSQQTYKNIEAVVCWDEQSIGASTILELYNSYDKYNIPVFICNTGREGYNLAMARNMGVINATGKYLLFCDSRMLPEKDAVETFIKSIWKLQGKFWLFGEKGGNKKTFVENFSMISRDLFIRAGMSNERITEYGGMSQELRERFAHQGFKFEYLPEAKATQMRSSSLKGKRKQIIRMKNIIHKLNI